MNIMAAFKSSDFSADVAMNRDFEAAKKKVRVV